jgi:hypothetical protein
VRRLTPALALALAVFAIASLAPRTSAADPPSAADRTLAQSLFEQGRRLMDTGHYAEACPKLADSQRLDPGGGTLLNLALCYDKLGRLATAYTDYNDALGQAVADHRKDREQFARDRIAALGARLPRIQLDVVNAPTDATVELDGTGVPATAWPTAIPVDPGAHTVHATAAGRPSLDVTVVVGESETRPVRIDLAQVIEPGPASTGTVVTPVPTPAPAPTPTPVPTPVSTVAPPADAPRTELRRPVSFWIIGGLGVVALGVSVATGVLAMNAHSDVQSKCNTDRGYCSDPSGVDSASQERTYAWISTCTVIGGALALILAISLPMEEHVRDPAKTALHLGAAPAPGGGVVVLGGTWR